MSVDPEIDHKRAWLPEVVKQKLQDDSRRIVIVGARGWIGRTILALLLDAMGPDGFAQRVACFGSAASIIDLGDGVRVPQLPLAELPRQAQFPTLLFHLAFLTKDKVVDMDPDEYARANRALSGTVLAALDEIGVDRLFLASSGAAAFADDLDAAADLQLYGRLKREDEERFAEWAGCAPARRAAIGRIHNISGPYMNKHETYALASFILDVLAGRQIEVRAPMKVFRSYVAARDLVALVLAVLLANGGQAVLRFETGGEALELGEVAQAVAGVLGGEVVRRTISNPQANHYVGDDVAWRGLLASHGLSALNLTDQIRETAAFLARVTEGLNHAGA